MKGVSHYLFRYSSCEIEQSTNEAKALKGKALVAKPKIVRHVAIDSLGTLQFKVVLVFFSSKGKYLDDSNEYWRARVGENESHPSLYVLLCNRWEYGSLEKRYPFFKSHHSIRVDFGVKFDAFENQSLHGFLQFLL